MGIRNTTASELRNTADYVTYVIQSGDTLSGIARRFGTTISALAALNRIECTDSVYMGNTIRVPEEI